MSTLKHNACLAAFAISVALGPIGCGQSPDGVDSNWSPPVTVSSSTSGLSGWPRIHRYKDTLVGVQSQGTDFGKFLFLETRNNSWSQSQAVSILGEYVWGYAAIDSQRGRIILPNAYLENEQLLMNVAMGTIENGGLKDITKRNWTTDKKALLGETAESVKLNFFGEGQQGVGLGPGILDGAKAWIPFAVDAARVTQQGKTRTIDRVNGPFANGVFHSSDYGNTWQMEKICEFNFGAPEMCRTKNYHYYFAIRHPITRHGVWTCRKPIGEGSWESPKSIVQTFANIYGRFGIAGEGETVHISWMDRRHNKWRFNLAGPPIENNDIYYRRRQDSDPDWGKEVHLSKGLTYSYAPTIAAEGDNVVVVWAGIRDAGRRHTGMGPNDIYYVTSKDGGKTWTKPLKVTDGAKDGITAGMPQVALLDGVIHLLYIQGANRSPGELSVGLTRLGNEPWPIYYQYRQFPVGIFK